MTQSTKTLARRSMGEWLVYSSTRYPNPFADVAVDATFSGPSGKQLTIPAFYDGEQTWRVRFNPDEVGRWTYRITSRPADAELAAEGDFVVTPAESRGFLQATPGRGWGFHFESGEPAFLLGDTVYNLFGMAYCGADVESFLRRRAEQGFNLLRIRVPVSPFHPPDGYSAWQTRRTWAWGGSEQAPRFDRFNLDYFRTVDDVVRTAEGLGLGIEMIMEGWGFEFPFNSRQIFVPEWEELWMRYLIARYDAFSNLFFWTPLNEYEFYPNGDWHYKPVADRWAIRIARWIKGVAQHNHIVSMHNGPREPAFAQRFAADPEAVDAIMFQEWGSHDAGQGWLAAGIEEQIRRSFEGWRGTAIFAEYGYERNPDFELLVPGHEFCDPEHTRRGAWRGACSGLLVIHGFENSWGPWQKLEEDQPGIHYLLQLRHFFTSVVPFHRLRPDPGCVPPGDYGYGRQPLAMSTPDRSSFVVYLPVGGSVVLDLPQGTTYQARWFDPRSGAIHPAESPVDSGRVEVAAPSGADEQGHPWDWVLMLSAVTGHNTPA